MSSQEEMVHLSATRMGFSVALEQLLLACPPPHPLTAFGMHSGKAFKRSEEGTVPQIPWGTQ